MTSPRFDVGALRDVARALLEAAGASEADAELVARSLVEADRAGIFSHGLLRLPLYLRAIEAGGIDVTARPHVVRERGAVAVLEASSGFGQVAMQEAVDLASAAADVHGMAAVAVQGSTHFGAGRFWIERLAEQGLAAILTSTTGPIAAPFGGARPVLGTNPLTIGLPSAGRCPLVADLATTAGAYGKIIAAHQEGDPIPAGWAVGADGQETTDPAAALEGGALIPFGGHKGSGISVLVEGLSAALSSAAFAFQTVDIWKDPSSRMNTGHLLLALDLTAFGDPERIRRKVDQLQQEIRDSGRTATVMAPGDLEHSNLRATEHAVELAPSTVTQLRELADARGIELPAPLDEGTT